MVVPRRKSAQRSTSRCGPSFLPEFLNRIDEKIIFHPLDRSQIRRIVDLQIRHLQQRVEQNGITLIVTDAAQNAIAAEGYDPSYGARPLKRVIQQRLENELARELLRGGYGEGDCIEIDHDGIDFGMTHAELPADAEIILVFSCIGIYTVNHSAIDIYMMVTFGVLGYLFMKLDCEPAPFVLGFLLGPMLEEYFRRSMLLSRGSFEIFVTKPISAAFLIGALALLAMMVVPVIRRRKDEAAEAE